MARKEFDSVIHQLPFFNRFLYKNWRLSPAEIESFEISAEAKKIIRDISKPGFVFRYTPKKRKSFEQQASYMWQVFQENGVLEETDKFKEFYQENFLEFDFEIHRRMLSLLDFCKDRLTDQGGRNFVNALLSVGEERNYFDFGDSIDFIRKILFWNPFGREDNRLMRWLDLIDSQN